MGDYLKKVQSGQPLRIPAVTFNTFIDVANDYLQRRQNQGRQSMPAYKSSSTVFVKNNSSTDINRFGILGIDGIVISPADNLIAFSNNPVLSGVTPAIPDHLGRFVILAEPLVAGNIGRAWISGCCPVQINMAAEGHKRADIITDDTQKLASGASGSIEILYAESGTGTKWAIVRFGVSGKITFTAKITGSTQIGPNKWRYTWVEVIAGIDGTYCEVENGKTSAIYGEAYNRFEAFNSDSGIQGNGVNLADVPSGRLLPIGAGPVEITLEINVNGDLTPRFQAVNIPDGRCAA